MGFCPECRSEYVPGIEVCPGCETDLVESLPPEEELAAVYAATDLLETKLVKATLEADGIEAVVLSREDSMFPARGSQSGYRVAVKLSQTQQAREIIKEAMAEKIFGGSGELI